jgi:hypothetical protein
MFKENKKGNIYTLSELKVHVTLYVNASFHKKSLIK